VRWHTDVLMVLVATIWGVNFPVLKYATQFISPLAINGFRIPIAAGAQLAMARGMNLPRPSARDVRAMIALGMLGNGVYQVFFILGLVRAQVATAALIIAATPAFVAVLGRLRGTEHLTRVQWSGVALQILGCSTVALGAVRSPGENTIVGVALLLGAAFSWSIYAVSLKRYSDHVAPWYLGGYTMLGGAIVMGVVGLPAILMTKWSAAPWTVWLALMYATFIAMVIAYLLYYRGLKILGPTRTSMYSNLQPLVAMGLAWLMLHETPTVAQTTGASMIVGGLLLARLQIFEPAEP
jgi:drug/metabolite transporter (DMT)-like permease